MRTTMVYEYYTSRHSTRGVDHWPVIIVAGEDGVEDIVIRADGLIEIRYSNGDYDLLPNARVYAIKVRNGGYPAT